MTVWRRMALVLLGFLLLSPARAVPATGDAAEPTAGATELSAPEGGEAEPLETGEPAEARPDGEATDAEGAPAAAEADATDGGAADDAEGSAEPEAPGPRRPGEERLREAWRAPTGTDLGERVRRVRAVALDLGIRSLDAGARALLLDPTLGTPLERAEGAVALASDLPDAHFALARARIVEAHDPAGALASLRAAWRALDRHLEASLWFRAAVLDVVMRACFWGGLLFLLVAAGVSVARAAQSLDAGGIAPASVGAAALALLVAPVALGEGALGVAWAAALLAVSVGQRSQRVAVTLAGLVILAGLYPAAQRFDAELRVLSEGTVAEAVHRTERSLATPIERVRLQRSAATDPLAARALAVDTKRAGDIAGADRRLQALLQLEDPPAELLANAGNVRLAMADLGGAIELYERATERDASPLLLFNLSQVYGRAIQLDDQDIALADAQRLDAAAVRELTDVASLAERGGALDLFLPIAAVRASIDPTSGSPAFRRRMAPGLLGAGAGLAAGGLVLAWVAGAGLGRWLARVGGAARDPNGGPSPTDPTLRMARLAAQRRREETLQVVARVLAWAVPGAASLQARRPLLALFTSWLGVGAVLCLMNRGGVVPDPLAGAATGAFVLVAVAMLLSLAYAALLVVGVALREGS